MFIILLIVCMSIFFNILLNSFSEDVLIDIFQMLIDQHKVFLFLFLVN